MKERQSNFELMRIIYIEPIYIRSRWLKLLQKGITNFYSNI